MFISYLKLLCWSSEILLWALCAKTALKRGFFPLSSVGFFNCWNAAQCFQFLKCIFKTTHLCALFEHSSFNFHSDSSEKMLKIITGCLFGGFSPLKLSPVILNKSRNKKLGLLHCFYYLYFERTSWWRSILLHGRENAVNFMLNCKKGFFVIAGTHDSQLRLSNAVIFIIWLYLLFLGPLSW